MWGIVIRNYAVILHKNRLINKAAKGMTNGKYMYVCTCIKRHIIQENKLNQSSVSFMHMSNAFLNCVASLRSLS